MMRSGLRWVAVALVVAASPVRVSAQSQAGETKPLQDVISANPFLLIAEWFNAEWEHRRSSTTTLGVRVSRFDTDDSDVTYFSIRGFWRYYPDGAFEKFFFGFDGGVTSLDDSGDTSTVFGAGFELGYNWLMGARRTFYVSLGAGADRLFGGDLHDASAVIPTLRLVNVGIRF
jgi:hypothetical protein